MWKTLSDNNMWNWVFHFTSGRNEMFDGKCLGQYIELGANEEFVPWNAQQKFCIWGMHDIVLALYWIMYINHGNMKANCFHGLNKFSIYKLSSQHSRWLLAPWKLVCDPPQKQDSLLQFQTKILIYLSQAYLTIIIQLSVTATRGWCLFYSGIRC